MYPPPRATSTQERVQRDHTTGHELHLGQKKAVRAVGDASNIDKSNAMLRQQCLGGAHA